MFVLCMYYMYSYYYYVLIFVTNIFVRTFPSHILYSGDMRMPFLISSQTAVNSDDSNMCGHMLMQSIIPFKGSIM